MSKHTETIDRYLLGQMSADEKKNFERELETNAELKAEVELQRQVMKGVQRHGMKQAAQKGFQKGSFKAKLFKWGTAVLIVAAATTLVWVAKDKLFTSQQNNIRYELNEEGKKQWADADKYLSPQVFEINSAKDTVIETSGGIVIAVPAGAFYDKFGAEVKDKIEIEIKEALDPVAIMQAGLSTTSDGKLLETGGMFYINARKNGENLNIAQNKGLYVNVPTDKVKEGMRLFEGKRMENGQINWVNPAPLETNIPTVDITTLNFYPPHFLDSVASFGFDAKNKRLTDSIYYSLECDFRENNEAVEYHTKADSSKRPSRAPSLDEKLKMEADARRIADSIANEINKAIGAALSNPEIATPRDGKTLFVQNCAVCHTLTDEKLTGPGLKGIKERVPGGDWLFNYIKNNEKMIKSGDPYANKIFRENGNASMTVFEGTLSDDQIRALTEYIGSPSFAVHNTGSSSCEIAPSRIHAIWDPKYNGTILATRQFEERLQTIFQTCNGGILDLYVNNLNAKFYELDAQAAQMCGDKPECQHKFEEFAKRRDGGVSVEASHMRMLNEYFRQKQQVYKEAMLTTLKRMYDKEEVETVQALEKKWQHDDKEDGRQQKMLQEELDANMKEAYKQLGKPFVPGPLFPPRVYYGGAIVSTGWKNVDAYVVESTLNRTTLDYTDNETGKKAVIKYEPLSVQVDVSEGYDRLFAYLLPDKLSSFQRMTGDKPGAYTEKLNETMRYDLIVIAMKGEDVYFKQINDVKPGEQRIKLDRTSHTNVQALMSARTFSSYEPDFANELKFIVGEQMETIRQRKIQKREEITYSLRQVALPCYGVSEVYMADEPVPVNIAPAK